MTESGFAASLRQQHATLWQAFLDHPFLRALAEGRLPGDRFEFFLTQDHLYLVELARVLALASARAETVEEMEVLAGLQRETLSGELPLLERTAAALGLGREALRRAEPGLVTRAYGDALLRVASQGTTGEVVAALLPCQVSYPAIADRWGGCSPEDPHHRGWLAACGSPGMRALAASFAGLVDARARRAGAADLDRWRRHYASSLRFELLFLEAAWEKQAWPACVPPAATTGAS